MIDIIYNISVSTEIFPSWSYIQFNILIELSIVFLLKPISLCDIQLIQAVI